MIVRRPKELLLGNLPVATTGPQGSPPDTRLLGRAEPMAAETINRGAYAVAEQLDALYNQVFAIFRKAVTKAARKEVGVTAPYNQFNILQPPGDGLTMYSGVSVDDTPATLADVFQPGENSTYQQAVEGAYTVYRDAGSITDANPFVLQIRTLDTYTDACQIIFVLDNAFLPLPDPVTIAFTNGSPDILEVRYKTAATYYDVAYAINNDIGATVADKFKAVAPVPNTVAVTSLNNLAAGPTSAGQLVDILGKAQVDASIEGIVIDDPISGIDLPALFSNPPAVVKLTTPAHNELSLATAWPGGLGDPLAVGDKLVIGLNASTAAGFPGDGISVGRYQVVEIAALPGPDGYSQGSLIQFTEEFNLPTDTNENFHYLVNRYKARHWAIGHNHRFDIPKSGNPLKLEFGELENIHWFQGTAGIPFADFEDIRIATYRGRYDLPANDMDGQASFVQPLNDEIILTGGGLINPSDGTERLQVVIRPLFNAVPSSVNIEDLRFVMDAVPSSLVNAVKVYYSDSGDPGPSSWIPYGGPKDLQVVESLGPKVLLRVEPDGFSSGIHSYYKVVFQSVITTSANIERIFFSGAHAAGAMIHHTGGGDYVVTDLEVWIVQPSDTPVPNHTVDIYTSNSPSGAAGSFVKIAENIELRQSHLIASNSPSGTNKIFAYRASIFPESYTLVEGLVGGQFLAFIVKEAGVATSQRIIKAWLAESQCQENASHIGSFIGDSLGGAGSSYINPLHPSGFEGATNKFRLITNVDIVGLPGPVANPQIDFGFGSYAKFGELSPDSLRAASGSFGDAGFLGAKLAEVMGEPVSSTVPPERSLIGLENRLREISIITVGLGVTNSFGQFNVSDYPTVNATIEAAVAALLPVDGGVISFKPGVYGDLSSLVTNFVDNHIRINRDNVVLRAEALGSVTIKLRHSPSVARGFCLKLNGSNLGVQDIRFDSDAPAAADASPFLDLENAVWISAPQQLAGPATRPLDGTDDYTDVSIHNCEFAGFTRVRIGTPDISSAFITSAKLSGVRITNCDFDATSDSDPVAVNVSYSSLMVNPTVTRISDLVVSDCRLSGEFVSPVTKAIRIAAATRVAIQRIRGVVKLYWSNTLTLSDSSVFNLYARGVQRFTSTDSEFYTLASGNVPAITLDGYAGRKCSGVVFHACTIATVQGFASGLTQGTLDVMYTDGLIVSECNIESVGNASPSQKDHYGVTLRTAVTSAVFQSCGFVGNRVMLNTDTGVNSKIAIRGCQVVHFSSEPVTSPGTHGVFSFVNVNNLYIGHISAAPGEMSSANPDRLIRLESCNHFTIEAAEARDKGSIHLLNCTFGIVANCRLTNSLSNPGCAVTKTTSSRIFQVGNITSDGGGIVLPDGARYRSEEPSGTSLPLADGKEILKYGDGVTYGSFRVWKAGHKILITQNVKSFTEAGGLLIGANVITKEINAQASTTLVLGVGSEVLEVYGSRGGDATAQSLVSSITTGGAGLLSLLPSWALSLLSGMNSPLLAFLKTVVASVGGASGKPGIVLEQFTDAVVLSVNLQSDTGQTGRSNSWDNAFWSKKDTSKAAFAFILTLASNAGDSPPSTTARFAVVASGERTTTGSLSTSVRFTFDTTGNGVGRFLASNGGIIRAALETVGTILQRGIGSDVAARHFDSDSSPLLSFKEWSTVKFPNASTGATTEFYRWALTNNVNYDSANLRWGINTNIHTTFTEALALAVGGEGHLFALYRLTAGETTTLRAAPGYIAATGTPGTQTWRMVFAITTSGTIVQGSPGSSAVIGAIPLFKFMSFFRQWQDVSLPRPNAPGSSDSFSLVFTHNVDYNDTGPVWVGKSTLDTRFGSNAYAMALLSPNFLFAIYALKSTFDNIAGRSIPVTGTPGGATGTWRPIFWMDYGGSIQFTKNDLPGIPETVAAVSDVSVPATFVIAAPDSVNIGRADYVATSSAQNAINTALRDLEAESPGGPTNPKGGSIVLLEGTYNITDVIKIGVSGQIPCRHIKFIGQGRGSTKIVVNSTHSIPNNGSIFVNENTSSGPLVVEFEDLTIEGASVVESANTVYATGSGSWSVANTFMSPQISNGSLYAGKRLVVSSGSGSVRALNGEFTILGGGVGYVVVTSPGVADATKLYPGGPLSFPTVGTLPFSIVDAGLLQATATHSAFDLSASNYGGAPHKIAVRRCAVEKVKYGFNTKLSDAEFSDTAFRWCTEAALYSGAASDGLISGTLTPPTRIRGCQFRSCSWAESATSNKYVIIATNLQLQSCTFGSNGLESLYSPGMIVDRWAPGLVAGSFVSAWGCQADAGYYGFVGVVLKISNCQFRYDVYPGSLVALPQGFGEAVIKCIGSGFPAYASVRDCEFTGVVKSKAIELVSVESAVVSGCTFRPDTTLDSSDYWGSFSGDTLIRAELSTVSIKDSTFTSPRLQHVLLVECSDCDIRGNVFDGPNDNTGLYTGFSSCVELTGTASFVSRRNRIIENSFIGLDSTFKAIRLANYNDMIQVRNNVGDGSFDRGVQVEDTDSQPAAVVVGNRFGIPLNKQVTNASGANFHTSVLTGDEFRKVHEVTLASAIASSAVATFIFSDLVGTFKIPDNTLPSTGMYLLLLYLDTSTPNIINNPGVFEVQVLDDSERIVGETEWGVGTSGPVSEPFDGVVIPVTFYVSSTTVEYLVRISNMSIFDSPYPGFAIGTKLKVYRMESMVGVMDSGSLN